MKTNTTASGDGTNSGTGKDSIGKHGGPDAHNNSFIVSARLSPELAKLNFSIDTHSANAHPSATARERFASNASNDRAQPTGATNVGGESARADASELEQRYTTRISKPPLTEEQQGRFERMMDACAFISNKRPAEPLENFPERGQLEYRRIAWIKVYNAATGGNLPISEETYNRLGRSRGIGRTLVDDAYWGKVQVHSDWARYLELVEPWAKAREYAQHIKGELLGKTVDEYDVTFGSCGGFRVQEVKAKNAIVQIIGQSIDGRLRQWEGNVAVLSLARLHGTLREISNRYGSTLKVVD